MAGKRVALATSTPSQRRKWPNYEGQSLERSEAYGIVEAETRFSH